MKPNLLSAAIFQENIAANNIPKAIGSFGFEDSGISSLTMEEIMSVVESAKTHILDSSLHINLTQKNAWTEAAVKINDHVADTNIHMTDDDRFNLLNAETKSGATEKMNSVQNNLSAHEANSSLHVTQQEKNILHDKYTKIEIDNIVSGIMSESMYKESVATFADLAKEYPNAEIGWMATVEADGVTYRYNGVEWKGFSNDTIPLATKTLDGKLSSAGFIKLESVEYGANNYQHPTGSQYNHVSDNQIDYWNGKAANEVATEKKSGLMHYLDYIKLKSVETGANNYIHPELHDASIIKESVTKQFISSTDRDNWNNKASTKLATPLLDGLLGKDMYTKISNIEEGANKYIHPANHSLDMMTETDVYKLVTKTEKDNWNSKESVESSDQKAYATLMSAKAYTDSKINEIYGTAISNSAYHKETLSYTKWTTYPSYFVYTITLLNKVNCSNISIGVDLTSSAEQFELMKTCNMQVLSTENDCVITLRSDIKPNIDLKLLLIFGTVIS